MYEKPEPKVLQKAGEKLVTTNLSIKKIVAEQTNNQAQQAAIQNEPAEEFTIDQVNMFWRQFANRMKDEGKETFYNALVKRNPKQITNVLYQLEVDNNVQIEVIKTDFDRFMTFMRNSLKNFAFFVEVKVTDNQSEDVKHLNGKDKFAILARKFPYINTLKDTFNLDIDY